MAEKSKLVRPSRSSRGGSGRTLDYIALGVLVIASIVLAALAFSGFTLRPGNDLAPTSRPAPTFSDVPNDTSTGTPTASMPARVSLLAGATSVDTPSWWSLSVGASAVDGVVDGGQLKPAESGSASVGTAAAIQARIDESPALEGYVLVEAGTADLAEGASPSDTAVALQAVWRAVTDRGATPIAVLVPPSRERQAQVKELNGLIATAADADGISVLDLNTPVAKQDGSWVEGLSDDGEVANNEGVRILAASVAAQLPVLATKK